MKKSATIKRKTIKLVVKNLIVFAVLIAVASVGVRSWFNDQEASKVDAKGMTNINFSAPEGMQIAVVAANTSIKSTTVWHDETFTLDKTEFPFIETVKLSEISSDGRTFIKPPIMQYGSVAYPDTRQATDWSNSVISTTPNVEYLSFDVYFRTRNSGYKVQLDNTTYCGPDDPANIAWGNSVNGWSPDTVIGAARLSVIDPTVTDANADRNTWQKLLWIPAPFLHYDPVTYHDDQLKTNVIDTTNQYGLVWKNGNSFVQLHNNGARGDGTYNHGYWLDKNTRSRVDYSSSASDAKTNVTANTSLTANDIFTLPYDVDIADLVTPAKYNDVQYYTDHVRINIWIEGEDPESRSTQLTGKIKANLKFKLATASGS